MTVLETVNRIFREFKRYTGDGLPGEPINAALPVGDPQSGPHNPKKSELRAAFVDILEGIENAGGDAQAILDDLLERYLGSYASDADATAAAGTPTQGQLYFNSTDGKFRVYHSGAWQDQSVALGDGDVTDAKVSSDPADRISASKLKYGSPHDPAWAPSVASLFASRVVLSDLADISSPAKFSGALQYALDNGYHHIIIPGRSTKWQMSSGVVLPARPIWIEGEGNPGRDTAGGTLIEYTGTGSAFKTTSGIKAPHFSNFKLLRAGTQTGLAASTLLGIEMPGLVEDALLEDLWIEGFYHSVKGGATSYSYMDNVIVDNSTSHGILIANNAVANGLQWSMNRCLVQRSGGSGYKWDTAGGTGPTSVGEMLNCNSYANGRYGLEVEDTQVSKLTGVRLTGGFYGEDKLGGIRIQSHRGLHKINGVECEIAGTAETGPPTGKEPASNAGWGILLQKPPTYANGTDFNSAEVSGSIIAFNTRSGIYSEFALTTVSGCEVRSNGQAGTAGANNGIQIIGTGTNVASVVTGCSIFGSKGYGISAQNDNHVWTANLLGGAAGTSLANTAGPTSTNGTGTANGVYTGNKIT